MIAKKIIRVTGVKYLFRSNLWLEYTWYGYAFKVCCSQNVLTKQNIT